MDKVIAGSAIVDSWFKLRNRLRQIKTISKKHKLETSIQVTEIKDKRKTEYLLRWEYQKKS